MLRLIVPAIFLLTGCGAIASDGTAPDAVPSADGQPRAPNGGRTNPASGMSCAFRRGLATLTNYRDDSSYAPSAFSFEYASQDPAVTYNEFDVLYQGNLLSVNTVTDDRSFIVDLGAILLDDVPPMVDPQDFPTGQWEEHDDIQAQLRHTYFVRNVDGAGRLVSAFTIRALEPGQRLTIEWARSTDPDRFVFPADCPAP